MQIATPSPIANGPYYQLRKINIIGPSLWHIFRFCYFTSGLCLYAPSDEILSLNMENMPKGENENVVHRNSNQQIKELMEKFAVSEQDVNVAIQIVGNHREAIEKYLSSKNNSRCNNIW